MQPKKDDGRQQGRDDLDPTSAAQLETVQVMFTRDHTTRETEARSFEAGEVYELRRDSADHFVKRGLAKLVEEEGAHQPQKAEGADLPEHLARQQQAIRDRKEQAAQAAQKAAEAAKESAKPAPEKGELPARTQSPQTGAVKGAPPPNVAAKQAEKPAEPGGTPKPPHHPK